MLGVLYPEMSVLFFFVKYQYNNNKGGDNMELRTVKVKLNVNQNQFESIQETAKICNKVFQFFANLCNQLQTVSYMKLHEPGYSVVRKQYPNLPSGLVSCVSKIACACIKSWNTNNPSKKWEYAGIKESLTIPLDALTYSRRGNLSTFSSVDGRIRVMHDIPKWFLDKYEVDQNRVQAANIKITKSGNIMLYLQYRVTCKDAASGSVVGIDRGLYNLAVLSDGTRYSSKKYTAVKRRRQYQRKKLQQKGTKSAKRRLRKLSGKEKRFMQDVNHVITKQLANRQNVSIYVLEDLSRIRQDRKGKKPNSWLSNWSYFQFQTFLEYKCRMNGINVVYCNPAYTSQKCNACKTIDKSARHKSIYTCPICGHVDHADINAAKNIRDNYLCRL